MRRSALAGALLLTLVLGPGRAAAQDLVPNPTEPTVSPEEAQLLESVTAQERHDRPGAIRRLQASIRPGSSAALDFALGVLLLRQDRLAEGEQSLAAATAKLPAFARAWEQLGKVRLLRGRPGEAAEALAKALEHGRSGGAVWLLLGRCHLEAECYPAAISAYRRALAFAPEDLDVRRGLVSALLAAELHLEAVPLLRELCAAEPSQEENWVLLANAYLSVDDDRRALRVLESARRLGALSAGARATLGDLCYQSGLYALAADRYAELPAEARGADRMLNCVDALLALRRLEEATSLLGRVPEAEVAEPARLHLIAARIALEEESTIDAKEAFSRALEADPQSGEAMMGLGEILLEEGNPVRARILFERATGTQGHRLPALVRLAVLAVERRDYEEAVTRLEEAIDLEPSPRLQRYLDQVRRIAGVE